MKPVLTITLALGAGEIQAIARVAGRLGLTSNELIGREALRAAKAHVELELWTEGTTDDLYKLATGRAAPSN